MYSRNVIFSCFIALALLTIACHKDDDAKPTNALKGSWQLANVSGGLMGVNIDYLPGDVIWEFDGASTLVVQNNLVTTGPQDIYAGFDSGTYPYEIKIENDKEVLYINNIKQGEFTIPEVTIDYALKIDHGVAVDGFQMGFQRLVYER